MIKINESFEIEKDSNCWILTQYYVGKNKEGREKTHSRQSYYTSLLQCCSAIIDRAAGVACSEARNIIQEIRKTKHDIFMALNSGPALGCKTIVTETSEGVDEVFSNNE